MAAKYDITIEQGATFVFSVQVTGVNLSGYTVRMQGRTSHAATTTVFSLTGGSGLTVTAGANSTIAVTIAASATANYPAPMLGVYDLEYELSGVVTRILEGSFTITPEVTR
jgi:hypothetical protein